MKTLAGTAGLIIAIALFVGMYDPRDSVVPIPLADPEDTYDFRPIIPDPDKPAPKSHLLLTGEQYGG